MNRNYLSFHPSIQKYLSDNLAKWMRGRAWGEEQKRGASQEKKACVQGSEDEKEHGTLG